MYKYNIEQEYKNIIEEVKNKFDYDDDLCNTLNKMLPAILNDKSYEEKQLFYDMLRSTPIVVVPKAELDSQKLQEQYIGNVNPHIIEIESEKTVYDSIEGEGAFVTEPILDENLNIVDTKKFIYVTKLDDDNEVLTNNQKERVELCGTRINVPHLFHELGHAWNAQRNPYSFDEDGNLVQRVGTSETKYQMKKTKDGKFTSERIYTSGIMIEEAMNSIFEKECMSKFLSVSKDEVDELYNKNIFIPSEYQGMISALMRETLKNNTLKDHFNNWRLQDNANSKNRLNEIFKNTNYYEKRDKLYNREDVTTEEQENEGIITKRNRILKKVLSNPVTAKIFDGYIDDFYPNTTYMTPMEMFNNILEEYYDIGTKKYNFEIGDYSKLLRFISMEGYGLYRQAENYLEKNKDGKENSRE